MKMPHTKTNHRIRQTCTFEKGWNGWSAVLAFTESCSLRGQLINRSIIDELNKGKKMIGKWKNIEKDVLASGMNFTREFPLQTTQWQLVVKGSIGS